MFSESVFNYNFLLQQASGSMRLAQEVLGLFRVQTSLYVQALKNAKTAEDVAYLAHGIRNSAGAVGAEKLAEAARVLEKERPTPDVARPSIAAIETALLEALHASEQMMQEQAEAEALKFSQ